MATAENKVLKEACDRLFNTLLAVCPAHKCETCGNDATKRCEECGEPFCEAHLYDIPKVGEKRHCLDCCDLLLNEMYLEFVGGKP